jgi:hypothetical protein
MYRRARLSTVRDILYCETACSRKAYRKILKVWSGDYIKDVERSHLISSLQVEELTLMNRLFGSDATCYEIRDNELQKSLLRLMPHDLYKNFRRATYKRDMHITMEDWIWSVSETEFLDELDVELTCLENVIVSFLLYLLGGFIVPRDDLKSQMNSWVKVNVRSLFNRPRELFLLTHMSPAVLARFTYWKCTAVLMGLMRLFAKNITDDTLLEVNKHLELEGYVIDDKSR